MSVGVRRREHSVAITFPSSSRFGCGFGTGSVPMTTSSRTSSRASAASSRQPGRGSWRRRPQLPPAQREAVFRSTGPGGSGGSPSASERRRSRGSGCRSVIASGGAAPPRWVGRLTYRPAPTTGMPRHRARRARGHRPAHSAVSCCVDAPSRGPASRPARRLLARRPLPSGFEGSTRQPLDHARAPLTISVRGLLATMASLDTPTRAGRDCISPPLSERCVAHDDEALIGGGTS